MTAIHLPNDRSAIPMINVAPGRSNVVLGVAWPLLVERWNGIPYTRPFARLRDTLRFLRLAFAGGRGAP